MRARRLDREPAPAASAAVQPVVSPYAPLMLFACTDGVGSSLHDRDHPSPGRRPLNRDGVTTIRVSGPTPGASRDSLEVATHALLARPHERR
jgi:hypothetical protein